MKQYKLNINLDDNTTIKTSTALPVPDKTSDLNNDSGFVTTDTKNTAGATDTSSKIFLIGATAQNANPQTYSHAEVYINQYDTLVGASGFSSFSASSSSNGGFLKLDQNLMSFSAGSSAAKLTLKHTTAYGSLDISDNGSYVYLQKTGSTTSTGSSYLQFPNVGTASSPKTLATTADLSSYYSKSASLIPSSEGYDIGSSSRDFLTLYLRGTICVTNDLLIQANGSDVCSFTWNSITPASNNAKDLGDSSYKWKDLYLSGSLKDGTNSITIAALNASINNFAQAYSSSSTYAVGAKVVYNGQLYKCSTTIPTAEAWNSAHWTAIKVSSGFVDLDTNQTVAGIKTFTDQVALSDSDTGTTYYLQNTKNEDESMDVLNIYSDNDMDSAVVITPWPSVDSGCGIILNSEGMGEIDIVSDCVTFKSAGASYGLQTPNTYLWTENKTISTASNITNGPDGTAVVAAAANYQGDGYTFRCGSVLSGQYYTSDVSVDIFNSLYSAVGTSGATVYQYDMYYTTSAHSVTWTQGTLTYGGDSCPTIVFFNQGPTFSLFKYYDSNDDKYKIGVYCNYSQSSTVRVIQSGTATSIWNILSAHMVSINSVATVGQTIKYQHCINIKWASASSGTTIDYVTMSFDFICSSSTQCGTASALLSLISSEGADGKHFTASGLYSNKSSKLGQIIDCYGYASSNVLYVTYVNIATLSGSNFTFNNTPNSTSSAYLYSTQGTWTISDSVRRI